MIRKWKIILATYLRLRGILYKVKKWAIWRGFVYLHEGRIGVENKGRMGDMYLT